MPPRLVLALASLVVVACSPAPNADLVHIPTLTGHAPPPPRAPIAPLVDTGGARPSPSPAPTGHRVGDKIRVEWHGQLYPATVLGSAAGGLTRIHYDGYGDEWDEDVEESRIQGRDEEIDD